MKPRNKNSTLLVAALALAASLSWATTASAASPVTVPNAGFESPAVANGAVGTAANWSIIGGVDAGVWNPTSTNYTAEAPEGLNIGYVYSDTAGTGLSQVLSATFQADASYTLSVKVGQSNTYAASGYTVQLLANGVVLTGGQDDNTNPPAADSFVTSTINYTYNVADAALVGQPLEIRLLGKGLAVGGETDFDDVQLTVTLANPAANPGGPYTVAIPGGSLSLDGSGSLPSEGQTITTWEWDLDDDGIYDVTGATPTTINYATLTAAPPAGYGMVAGDNTIKLRVTDDSSPTPKTSISAATVTLAEPSTTLSTGNWQGGAWSNGQPNGSGLNAIIAGNAAANGVVTSWSGDLFVNSGVTLTVTGLTADFIAVAGATNIRLSGTIVNNWKTRTLASNIIVSGGGNLVTNNNSANNQDQQFSGVISGTGGFSVSGRNHQGLTFTNVNTFTGGFTAQSQNQRYGIGFGTGSAGAGDVTILGTAGSQSAVIRVLGNDPFATTATLSLNGSGWNSTTGGFGPYSFYSGTKYNIDMNGKTATVDKLFVNGVQQASGTYLGGGAT